MKENFLNRLVFNKITFGFPEILFRIVIGVIFFESGWGKLNSIDGVISYFESLGIPFASYQAPFVAIVELIAGVMIFLGLFTRLSSFLLGTIMVVALVTAKSGDILSYTDLFGLSEFLYFIILVHLFFNGSNVLSLDSIFRKKCCSNFIGK